MEGPFPTTRLAEPKGIQNSSSPPAPLPHFYSLPCNSLLDYPGIFTWQTPSHHRNLQHREVFDLSCITVESQNTQRDISLPVSYNDSWGYRLLELFCGLRDWMLSGLKGKKKVAICLA